MPQPGLIPSTACHSNSASKYTDFSVILRNSNTIYGQKSKNTEEKRAPEGVASITTSGGVKRTTEKLHKIQKIFYMCTDDRKVQLEAM